jgi:hypothetical protein
MARARGRAPGTTPGPRALTTGRVGLVLLALAFPSACGTGLNALYEGDVRFEHCMALDSQRDVKPTLRKACWEEWAKFYTFGQTLDRIDYANLRMKQLSGASDFDEAEWTPAEPPKPAAVPEPTSAIAPPPLLLASDAGPSDASADADDASADAQTDAAPPGSACGDACKTAWSDCRAPCTKAACEAACEKKYKACMRKCF